MPKRIRKDQRLHREKVKIEPIPSSSPEARDEGPRLIPLRTAKRESMAGQKYLDIADRALGAKGSK